MTDLGATSSTPIRVLVVEDDYVARTFTVRALMSQGLSCDMAANGLEAEAKLRDATYDVVLTDLRMPGKHGYTLIRELLLMEPRPVIIVYTGILEPRLSCDLLERGVDDILYKPIEGSLLAAKVLAVWKHRSHHQRLVGAEFKRNRVSLDEAKSRLTEAWADSILSPAATDIYQMSRDSVFNAKRAAQTLARDAQLLATILDLANNAYFNHTGQRIQDEDQAIALLGQHRLGELVVGTQVLTKVSPKAPEWWDDQQLTRFGVAATMMADALVRAQGRDQATNGVLLGAMLMGAGHTVLATAFGDRYRAVAEECQTRQTSLIECELRHLPMGGPAAMAWVLGQQGVGREVTEALEHAGKHFSTLMDLPPELRARTECIKTSALFAKTALGRWNDWDLLELPPPSALGTMEPGHLEQLTRDVQQNAAQWRGDTRSAGRRNENLHLPRTVPYFTVSDPATDVLPMILNSLGCAATACHRDELCLFPATLINCQQTATNGEPKSDEISRWLAAWQGKLVALTDDGQGSRKVNLPCSVGQIRALLAHIGRRNRAQDRAATTSA